MYKMKYSCYQESSVILGWFVYWVFGWKMQHPETCLLWQLKLTEFFVNLWCFLLSFPTGCTKWNTAAINSLLLFMAGLFTEFLVEKCAACQSQKSDFGWHRFHFSSCWMRVEKSLKRLSGAASRMVSLSYYCVCFFISNFMKSSVVYEASLCTFVLRSETMIWPSMRFDISLQNFKHWTKKRIY